MDMKKVKAQAEACAKTLLEAAELAPGADFLPPLALRSAGETDKIDEWLKTLA